MRDRPKLGEILVRAGVIDSIQLKSALSEQQRWGNRLGKTLVEMGLVDEATLVRTLAAQLELPMVRLEGKQIGRDVLSLIPADAARAHRCLPLFVKEEDGGVRCLHLGMEDPSNLEALDDLAFQIGMRIRPVLVAPSELAKAIDRHYPGSAAPEALEADGAGDDVFLRDGPDLALASDDELALETDPDPDPEPRFASELPAHPGPPAAAGPIPPAAVLRAIAQLLIEKGVLTREELVERVRAQDGDSL